MQKTNFYIIIIKKEKENTKIINKKVRYDSIVLCTIEHVVMMMVDWNDDVFEHLYFHLISIEYSVVPK